MLEDAHAHTGEEYRVGQEGLDELVLSVQSMTLQQQRLTAADLLR